MWGRSASLFRRMIVTLGAIILVVALVLVVVARRHAQTAAADAYDRILVGVAEQIAETVGAESGVVSVDVSMAALETLSNARVDRVFWRVTDTDGGPVTGYDDLVLRTAPPAGLGPFVGDGRVGDLPVRVATIRRRVPDAARPGFVTTMVAHTLDARRALAEDLAGPAHLLIAVMGTLALAGAMIAARLAFRPLARIERAILERDPADLSPLDVAAPREIATLVSSIDGFMHRLSDRLGRLQRHVADVAHQIRTPITALAAQVDLAVGETDPARRRERLDRVAARIGELSRLTHQLLGHAMVLHRAEAVSRGPVDLREVAAEVVRLAVPDEAVRPLDLRLDIAEEPVGVSGDRVSLVEAVKNLVDNALRHGARRRLAIRVASEGERSILSVADDGPGIPADLRETATAPFAHGDGGGSGLGLAIVRDVVEAHGGELVFDAAPNGDFRVRLGFAASPIAPTEEVSA